MTQQRASEVLSDDELAQFERDQVTFARAGGRNETAIRVARELQRVRAVGAAGYEQGRADERAAVLADLARVAEDEDPWTVRRRRERIERGEHLKTVEAGT